MNYNSPGNHHIHGKQWPWTKVLEAQKRGKRRQSEWMTDLLIYQELEGTFLWASTDWTLCLCHQLSWWSYQVQSHDSIKWEVLWYHTQVISLGSKGLEIICCLSELWAEQDTDLKEGVGTCTTSPLPPGGTHLLPQAGPLGIEPPFLLSLNLPCKSMKFVILGRIKMIFYFAFLKPELCYLVTASIFAKLSLQKNRLSSIMTMRIFPDYLSKGRNESHFFKAGTYKVSKSERTSLWYTEVQPKNLQCGGGL